MAKKNYSNVDIEKILLCRCRVFYIGSAVSSPTKDRFQCIQQPLKKRYQANEKTKSQGIDSCLSVWSDKILLEYINDNNKRITNALFPISTLFYCTAVKYVNINGLLLEGGGEKFVPLYSPFAHVPHSQHPPIFTAVFWRTTGLKVLECHSFLCRNERAANTLVRCCFYSHSHTTSKLNRTNLNLKNTNNDCTNKPTNEYYNSEQKNEKNSNIEINNIYDKTKYNNYIIKQKKQKRQQDGEYDDISSIE